MATSPHSEVRIVDISVPFWSMVIFMVKWALASIPAIIILSVLGSIIYAVLIALMHHFPSS
jgi:hypothetical protein